MELQCVETFQTPYCCNALLEVPPNPSSSSSSSSHQQQYLVGMYELEARPQQQDDGKAASSDSLVAGKANDENQEEEDEGLTRDETAKQQKRTGSVFSCRTNGPKAVNSLKGSWQPVAPKMDGGVFDLHLESKSRLSINVAAPSQSGGSSSSSDSIVVVTCSDGFLRFFDASYYSSSSSSGSSSSAPVHVEEVRVNDAVLTSSCVPQYLSNTNSIVTCQQGGSLTLFDLQQRVEVESWQGHDFDSWCCQSFANQTNSPWSFASGSDDGLFKAWDLRVGTDMAVANKRFTAGVTSIVPFPSFSRSSGAAENCFFIGSYDENLYLFDRRTMKKPLSEYPIGGGAWRVRPASPHSSTALITGDSSTILLAVAGMQSGGVLLTLSADGSTFDEVARTPIQGEARGLNSSNKTEPAPDALIYDASWDPVSQELVTCDFYAKALQRWTLPKSQE